LKEKKEFTQRSQRWEHREEEERTHRLQKAQSAGYPAIGCLVRGDLKVAATRGKRLDGGIKPPLRD